MPMLMRRLTTVALALATALLLLPAAGQAAVRFGALRTTNDPNGDGCGMTACTLVSYVNPVDPAGDPYAGGSPVGGVVTAFQIRAYATDAPAQITFRVGDVSRPDPGDTGTAVADVTGTGPTVTIPVDDDGADVPLRSFPARVPIARGQHLAIDDPGTVNAIYATSGAKFTYAFAPPLVDGQGPRGSTGVTEELLVSATVEPDADRDGFGDETQDSCSTDASRQGACKDGTITTPTPLSIGTLRVRGGTIRYSLSTRATVSLRLARVAAGHKANGRCVRPTLRNADNLRCTRFIPLGRAFAGGGSAGDNTVALTRPHGKRLAAGSYRLMATARGAADTVTATTRFTIAPHWRHGPVAEAEL
jgi:hypothetical protein